MKKARVHDLSRYVQAVVTLGAGGKIASVTLLRGREALHLNDSEVKHLREALEPQELA